VNLLFPIMSFLQIIGPPSRPSCTWWTLRPAVRQIHRLAGGRKGRRFQQRRSVRAVQTAAADPRGPRGPSSGPAAVPPTSSRQIAAVEVNGPRFHGPASRSFLDAQAVRPLAADHLPPIALLGPRRLVAPSPIRPSIRPSVLEHQAPGRSQLHLHPRPSRGPRQQAQGRAAVLVREQRPPGPPPGLRDQRGKRVGPPGTQGRRAGQSGDMVHGAQRRERISSLSRSCSQDPAGGWRAVRPPHRPRRNVNGPARRCAVRPPEWPASSGPCPAHVADHGRGTVPSGGAHGVVEVAAEPGPGSGPGR